MELKVIIEFFKKHLWKIGLLSSLFLVFGVGAYFLPPKYIASGSFIVIRNIEPLVQDFSYEGYYAQLTSQDFSKNLVSFFDNESILYKVSSNLGISSTMLKRKIRVVKEAPSVTRLEVRDRSADVAMSVWTDLRDQAFGLVDKINQETEAGIKVMVIGDDPILKQQYRNIYVYGGVGYLIGLTLFTFYFALKEYLK